MVSARGRGLRPGGVVRALVRLAVLVAVGFGVGLVFGVVLEEPELLASHLFGESRSVELAIDRGEGDLAEDAGTSAPALAEAAPDGRQGVSPEERALDSALPGVAAAASEAKAPRTARPSAEARAAAAPAAPARMTTPRRPEVSDRATAERRWSIQVGAFGDAAAAERLADGLRNRYPVAVLPARETGGRWRVRIQPIAGEDEARTMADRLKRDEHLPTWVTPMESGSDS